MMRNMYVLMMIVNYDYINDAISFCFAVNGNVVFVADRF